MAKTEKVVHPWNGQVIEVTPERADVFRQRGYTDYQEPVDHTAEDSGKAPKSRMSARKKDKE